MRRILQCAALAATTFMVGGAVRAQAADLCPNAAVRTGQTAALPDCRGWERVSPADKNGGDAGGNLSAFHPLKSSPTGDSVLYYSNEAFADSATRSLANTYVATRNAGGWSTHATLPPLGQDQFAGNSVGLSNFVSPDFSKSLVYSAAPLTAAPPPGPRNLYLRDDATNTYRLITINAPTNLSGPPLASIPHAVGVSADFNHVLVQSPLAMTADALATSPSNVYEWVAGTPDTFRLASILPGGFVPFGGAVAGSGKSFDNAMSADGSRIFFTTPVGFVGGNLYVRKDGASTELIAPSAVYYTATKDGSSVLFTDAGGVRRYDVDGHTTTNLSVDQAPVDGSDPHVVGVLGASDDLSRVYFVATGQLVAGQGTEGENNLYVSHDGEVKFIGTLTTGDALQGLWETEAFRRQSAVSPDGRRLAFPSSARLTGYDNAGGEEMYVYDDTAGTLSCATCADAAGSSTDIAMMSGTGTNGLVFGELDMGRQRNFSADGSRVYFQTNKALVPEDSNRSFDVYQWSGGETRLISGGGGGGDGALFLGTSPSGDDVFFVTRDQLVSEDGDDLNDVYDARVGGGFAAPPAPQSPCVGEACHGQPTAPPAQRAATSASFTGPGNPRPTPKSATAVSVSKPKLVTGTAVNLKVRVSGAGVVSASGRSVRTTRRSATTASTLTIKVTLSAKALATLKRDKRLVTPVRVAFTPRSGKAAVKTVTVTFKQPKASTRAARHATVPSSHARKGR